MSPTQEQMETILRVIDRIAPSYVFGFYEVDDIKQESYIICHEALQRWDQIRPLENFLSKNLANRLKTLIRDKYSRATTTSARHAELNDRKRRLVDLRPASGDYEPVKDFEGIMLTREAIEHVRTTVDPKTRNDLDRVLNGVSITAVKRKRLYNKIREILGESWTPQ
jgi:DNA-directed RNA polymerase specialized sigma24 family protein